MSTISSTFINHISPDIFRKSFNAQTATTQNLLRQFIKSEFSTDTLGGTIIHAAIIVSIEQTLKINDNSSFFGFLKSTGVSETRSYKVLIPELHSGLPTTELLPDLAKISDKKTSSDQRKELKEKYVRARENIRSYATVVEFNPDDPANSTLKIGEPVWVLFQNSRTIENGFLFSRITNYGVIGSEALKRGTVQLPDVTRAKPFVAPSDAQKATNRNPPGFDGRYIVPFDIIIEMMASSKGAPYRYHNFPRIYSPDVIANDEGVADGIKRGRDFLASKGVRVPILKEEYDDLIKKRPYSCNDLGTTPWENNIIGVQCNGFSMRALERMGIINDLDRRINTPILGAEALGVGTLRELFKRANTRGMLHLIGNVVPLGEQLPGDYVLSGGDAAANCSHMVICVSYPDKSKNN